ncbi:response regulator [Fundidesulfovibrio butyratiphilus]
MPEHLASPKTILTVDDDLLIRSSLAAWIEDSGYRPLQASNGQEGLALLQEHAPDLVLLDLCMPDMDGLDFLEEKRRRNDETPVIVVSGQSDLQDAIQAFRLGAWDYITKPIETFELLDHAVSVVLERRELANKVHAAEARYANLVQNIPLVIFSLGPDLELRFVNRACHSLLGFSREQAMAEPGWLLKRVHPDEREVVRHVLEQSQTDSALTFSKTCRFLHKTGRLVHGIIKSIPHAGVAPNGEPGGVEGVIVDITDRLMLEKFLMQKEKIKTLGAISAEVAHEIRNPLVSIGGFARRLLKKEPDQPEAAIIFGEAQRLERILDRIRNYLNPVRMHRVALRLSDVVYSCLALLRPELEANLVVPRLEIAEHLPDVEEDPDLLTQVVINVVRFTLSAMPAKGEMWIRLFASEKYVHVEVGGEQAKPVEDAEKLFLPFDEGGDTIGLPYCHRLLRSTGGSLTFEQKDAKGVFTVSLPPRAGRAPEEASPADAS